MPLSRDLREFIECLNSNEVEYLIVGALAVSWHGFARYSADVDFLIRPSQANAVRVLRALSQFGFGSLDISASDLTFYLDGIPVNFIGRSSLLRNKDATGRAKDRIDAEELRKQKPST